MDDGLTVEEAEEMIEAFYLFDKDKSGSICGKELKGVLHALGQNPSQREVDLMLKKYANEESGTIDLENYKRLIGEHTLTPDVIKVQLHEAFRKFDKDNSGTINFAELNECLTTRGERLTRKEAKEFLKLADTDGDGYLSLGEFVNLLYTDPVIVKKC